MSNSVTPWAVAHRVPLSMDFSRQKYWSGLPFPTPGDLPDPGIKPISPALQAVFYPLSHQGSPFLYRLISNSVRKEDYTQLCCLGFSGCRALAVGCVGSAAAVHGLSCSLARGIFRTRDRTHVLLALAGRFFTREPPGKSCTSVLKLTERQ